MKLLSFLDHNILLLTQTGFRKNKSTAHQLAFMVQEIETGFEEKQWKSLFFSFDMTKAFDKVWH